MFKLLLVEDDVDLANGIIELLELEDIECDYASGGQTGLNLALNNHYDIIVLDLNLPQLNGISVCSKIREQGNDVPILMLTAKDTLDDKLAGFESGTDDYLVKPFDALELLARAKALANRRSNQIKKLTLADFTMDLSTKIATRGDKHIQLGTIGWKIIETLLRASPNVVSRTQLEDAIWRDDTPESGALKVHISRLRSKIDKPFDLPLIQTIPNHGFAMRVENDKN